MGWQKATRGLQRDIYISVDGTDSKIMEHSPFNRSLFSQKRNSPGLRHKINLVIHKDRIVWTNGPYPGGTTDFLIIRERLREQLEPEETVFAKRGYPDIRTNKPYTRVFYIEIHERVRIRQEKVSAKIKRFKILVYSFGIL